MSLFYAATLPQQNTPSYTERNYILPPSPSLPPKDDGGGGGVELLDGEEATARRTVTPARPRPPFGVEKKSSRFVCRRNCHLGRPFVRPSVRNETAKRGRTGVQFILRLPSECSAFKFVSCNNLSFCILRTLSLSLSLILFQTSDRQADSQTRYMWEYKKVAFTRFVVGNLPRN